MVNTDTLVVFQGSDFGFTLTLTEEDGTPVDLTGASAAYQARGAEEDALPLLDLDSATKGGISLGGVSGLLTVAVPALQSSSLTLPSALGAVFEGGAYLPCHFVLDHLEVKLADNKTHTVRRGKLAFIREVVR